MSQLLLGLMIWQSNILTYLFSYACERTVMKMFYFNSQLQGIPSGIDANWKPNQQEAMPNYFTNESPKVWMFGDQVRVQTTA